jgi:hypothetical protein
MLDYGWLTPHQKWRPRPRPRCSTPGSGQSYPRRDAPVAVIIPTRGRFVQVRADKSVRTAARVATLQAPSAHASHDRVEPTATATGGHLRAASRRPSASQPPNRLSRQAADRLMKCGAVSALGDLFEARAWFPNHNDRVRHGVRFPQLNVLGWSVTPLREPPSNAHDKRNARHPMLIARLTGDR